MINYSHGGIISSQTDEEFRSAQLINSQVTLIVH